MNGKNIQNNKNNNEGEFSFINEKVVKNKKSGAGKCLLFLVPCGIIIGIVACAVFIYARPYLNKLLNSAKDDAVEAEQLGITAEITSDSELTDDKDKIGTLEDRLDNMEKSVVTISLNDKEDLTSTEIDNSNYSSGLILYVGKSIKILTTYDFVKNNREITVYFEKKGYKGNVENVNKEYGLAIVNVEADKLTDSIIEGLSAAIFNDTEECGAGNEITFMGNPYGKEKFVANGSLTSVGNTYNIMDAELEIMTTDISNTGLMNGFAFNVYGNVIGMVNDELNGSNIGENVISIISIDEIKIYIEKLLRKQNITYLGIYGKQVTDEVIENIDKDMPYGIYILNTEEKSPAYVAGVMNGDILTSINNKKVLDFRSFTEALQNCQVNDETEIKVMRKGKDGYKEIRYTVKIGGRQ